MCSRLSRAGYRHHFDASSCRSSFALLGALGTAAEASDASASASAGALASMSVGGSTKDMPVRPELMTRNDWLGKIRHSLIRSGLEQPGLEQTHLLKLLSRRSEGSG